MKKILYWLYLGWWLHPIRMVYRRIKKIKPFEAAGVYYLKKNVDQLMAEHGVDRWAASKPYGFRYEIMKTACHLIPDPKNKHDKNAIKVMVRGYHVGFVPADLTHKYKGKRNAHATIKGGPRADNPDIGYRITVS